MPLSIDKVHRVQITAIGSEKAHGPVLSNRFQVSVFRFLCSRTSLLTPETRHLGQKSWNKRRPFTNSFDLPPRASRQHGGKMARIPYLTLDRMPEKTIKMFDRPPHGLLNIQLALAHAEASVRHWGRLGTSLLTKAKLDPRFREITILRVATLSNCEYEWNQHFRLAKEAGLSEEQIEGIKEGSDNPIFTEKEKAILRYTDEVVKKVKASDEAFAAIQSFLDSREIAELTLSICYWEMVAKCIESLGVDLQPS